MISPTVRSCMRGYCTSLLVSGIVGIVVLTYLIVLIDFMVLNSQPGDNRYGSDPRGEATRGYRSRPGSEPVDEAGASRHALAAGKERSFGIAH